MSCYEKLMIIGASGHGRVVADIAARTGSYRSIAFLDDAPPLRELPFPYLGTCDKACDFINEYAFIVAIGNIAVRQKITRSLLAQGACLARVISPDAVIAADVTIGEGTVICPGVVINTGTAIGNGVIINTSSSVDHDCHVGDFCHVAVGAHLCGTVNVGDGCWISAGATVINNISICPTCMIGAGAVVVKNITAGGTYLGVPARRKA